MASKSLPDAMKAALRESVKEMIAAKFTDQHGKTMPEIPMAEILGISQTQLNDVRNKGEAGPTTLVALSLHAEKSINALLGPTAPPYGLDAPSNVVGIALRLADAIDTSGYGFGGKNLVIPKLVSDLRSACESIVEQPQTPSQAYREEVRHVAKQSPLGKSAKVKTKSITLRAAAKMATQKKVGT